VQKFNDEPLSVCSNCGGRLRKVFSPVGIVFKGSGFYRTDSRNGSSASKPAADKATEKTEKTEKKSSDTVSATSGSATPATSSSSSSPSEKVA
jgi:predicted nucleic acid-binding Zn ribbon protein